jgi:hypothetical protein
MDNIDIWQVYHSPNADWHVLSVHLYGLTMSVESNLRYNVVEITNTMH